MEIKKSWTRCIILKIKLWTATNLLPEKMMVQKQKKQEKEKNILPLLIDLANPSSATGLNNRERVSFIERTHCDLGLALALVHHLAIGKNIPFEKIAELFKNLADHFIVEFIPRTDKKVKFMLQQKKDIYHNYNEESFVHSFEKYFSIQKNQEIGDSGRILYMMRRHA